MLKIYDVKTCEGNYKVIAINEFFAKQKAYKEYKGTRNTNFKKFSNKILEITVLN